MGGEGKGEIHIYLSSHMHSHKCPFVLFFFGKREDIYNNKSSFINKIYRPTGARAMDHASY